MMAATRSRDASDMRPLLRNGHKGPKASRLYARGRDGRLERIVITVSYTGRGQLEGSRDAERAGTDPQRLASASPIELSKLQSLTDGDSRSRSPFIQLLPLWPD